MAEKQFKSLPESDVDPSGIKADVLLLARENPSHIGSFMLLHIAQLALVCQSRRERQVIALYLYQDLSYEETGRRLGLTESSVMEIYDSLKNRAMNAEKIALKQMQLTSALTRPLTAKKVENHGNRRKKRS